MEYKQEDQVIIVEPGHWQYTIATVVEVFKAHSQPVFLRLRITNKDIKSEVVQRQSYSLWPSRTLLFDVKHVRLVTEIDLLLYQ
jgi:hypothetical protein